MRCRTWSCFFIPLPHSRSALGFYLRTSRLNATTSTARSRSRTTRSSTSRPRPAPRTGASLNLNVDLSLPFNLPFNLNTTSVEVSFEDKPFERIINCKAPFSLYQILNGAPKAGFMELAITPSNQTFGRTGNMLVIESKSSLGFTQRMSHLDATTSTASTVSALSDSQPTQSSFKTGIQSR